MRLPEIVPARVVRRVHCSSCDQAFETDLIEELEELVAAVEAPVEKEAVVEQAPVEQQAPEMTELSLPEFNLPMFGDLELPGAVEVEPDPVAPLPIPEPLPELQPLIEDEPEELAEDEPEELLEGVVLATPEAKRPSIPMVELMELAEELLREIEELPEEPEPPSATETTAPKLSTAKLATPTLPQVKLPKVSAPKLPQVRLPKLNPQSGGWRVASAGLAVVAVIALLAVFQGGDESIAPPAAPTKTADAPSSAALAASRDADSNRPDVYLQGSGGGADKPNNDDELVRGSTYSLALPAGWQQTDSAGGAAFAAVSGDGTADAQLWISEDPKLDFPAFINLSLQQLESLAGSAQIVERIPGPTPETTIVRLAADAPAGQPSYEVTLRAAGPYRYYLASSVQPDASSDAVAGVELITGSFTPAGGE